MNHDYKTAFCTVCGAVAGAAFISQAWGLLLGMMILLLPWKLMGKTMQRLLIQITDHWRERELERLRKEEKGEVVV